MALTLLLPLGGSAFVIGGIAALRAGWRRGDSRRRLLVPIGWLLCALGCWLFARWQGGELGIPFALLLLCLAGAATVLINSEYRPPIKHKHRAAAAAPGTLVWRPALRIVVGTVLGLLAAVCAGLGLTLFGPGEEIDRIALGGLLVPVVWAAVLVWLIYTRRPTLVSTALSVAVLAVAALLT